MFWYEEICFRPVEERDLEDIRHLRNYMTTWLFLTDVTPITPEMQKAWFHRVSTARDKAYFSVFMAERNFPTMATGKFIGIIRIDEIDHNNRSVRVGADVVPDERGKGIGTKIFRALMEFCFKHWNMHRLWLEVIEDNEIARKMYFNAGFKEEGRLREAIWRDGRWKDYVVMSILQTEYNRD